jgi:hypothetical protein
MRIVDLEALAVEELVFTRPGMQRNSSAFHKIQLLCHGIAIRVAMDHGKIPSITRAKIFAEMVTASLIGLIHRAKRLVTSAFSIAHRVRIVLINCVQISSVLGV